MWSLLGGANGRGMPACAAAEGRACWSSITTVVCCGVLEVTIDCSGLEYCGGKVVAVAGGLRVAGCIRAQCSALLLIVHSVVDRASL
jgi:hypothetical protein